MARLSTSAIALVAFACLAALPRGAAAQTSGAPLQATAAPASLSGHVQGPGGVEIPGATVLLTDAASGARKETWTDESGDYRISALAPGTYRVVISLVGLAPFTQDQIVITDRAAAPVNATLGFGTPATRAPFAPGAGRQERAPTGAPGQQGADRGGAGGFRQGRRAPPGRVAAPDNGGADQGDGEDAAVRFTNPDLDAAPASSAGGGAAPADSGFDEPTGGEAASDANAFLLSGSVGRAATPGARGRGGFGRGPGGTGGGAPGFQASGAGGFGGGGFGGGGFGGFGGFGGGRADVNRMRGNFSQTYANSAFDADPFVLSGPQQPLPSSYREQTGFSLGGPFKIPGLYDGRRTTFFFNGSFGSNVNAVDRFATVPTASERAGDFAGEPTIYDPSTGAPFSGNRIPAARIDSASSALLQYMPLPNLPGAVNNYHLREAVPQQTLRLAGRIVQQLTARDSLNANYNFQSASSTSVNSFPELTAQSSNRGQSLSVGETHRFGTRMFNSLQFNLNARRVSTLNPFANTDDVEGTLGIQGASTDPMNWGLPLIQFTNFSGLNDTIASLTDNRTWRLVDSLVIVHGNHNLRIGGELRRVSLDATNDPDARGTFTFTGFATSAIGASGEPLSGTGLDFADFLLGLPQATSVRFGAGQNDFRSWIANGFVQDDWRATAHLTFDLGLRYDSFQPFTSTSGELSNLLFGPDFSSVSLITGVDPGDLSSALLKSDANNFSPHLAAAYRPSDEHSLVLRGGYGIFYDGGIYQRIAPNLSNQAPFAETGRNLSTPADPLTLQNGLPSTPPDVVPNTYAVDPDIRTPMAQTWSAGFEQSLSRYFLLAVNYVGTKGSNLDLLLGPNRFVSTGVDGSPVLALSGAEQFVYETTGADSIYHGLQVELRRQFHGGFGFMVNYTWSKSLDDASSIGGAGQVVAQNPLDLSEEWGLSAFDVRHRALFNANYRLPFGEGERFLSHGGPWAAMLGGWQVSGFGTYQSGSPFTAQVLGNTGATAGVGSYFALRGNATGQPVSLSDPTIQQYFNTAAFSVPPAGTLGNAGRGTIPGPPSFNVNMSLDRLLTLSSERGLRLDVRLTATNIFNTVNFTSLGTVVNAITFGQVTGVGPMRTLALSLRFRF
jgi:hypothetical protein